MTGSTDLLDLTHEMHPVSWKNFKEMQIEKCEKATVIGYGPFLPLSPTNPDVVQESVDYCMTVSKDMGQEFCVLTCDQAIYEIVLALQKKHPTKYDHLILRMGGFHIAMNFQGAIGKLMKGTGLEDLFIEGGVCLPGTANKIMSGKDYYQMLRAHTLVENAIYALFWEAFEDWLVEKSTGTDELSSLSIQLSKICDTVNSSKDHDVQRACKEAQASLDDVMKKMDEFVKTKCTSPTSQLWLMYIEMITILKRYISAERAGIWDLHIAAAEEILPYLVSAGHSKYVSCLPHYLNAMKNLPASIETEFKNGNFVVRKKEGKFNGVWTDMALEQTYNKDAKTKLFTGITQQPATISKYLKALPGITAVSEQTRRMANMNNTDAQTSSDDSSAVKDKKTVRKILNIVKEKMINPFSYSGEDLVNISTGQLASTHELIQAKERGLAALADAEKSNSEKVQPVHLKTFIEKVKKTASPALKSKKLYIEESAVIRSLCFAQNLSKKEKLDAFSHEWAEYPSSLFDPDDDHPSGYAMRKGNKADYLIALKGIMGSNWEEKENLPVSDQKTCMLVDMMAFVQRYRDMGSADFEQLQRRYLAKITSMRPEGCNVVHVIGDRYDVSPSDSLKHEERYRREKASQTTRTYVPHRSLPVPQWKHFIGKRENKRNLLQYLYESWAQECHTIPDDCIVIVGGFTPGPAIMLSQHSLTELPCLVCPAHEEADTRVFAHALYSIEEQNCSRIVIEANDTDIIVMGIFYSSNMSSLKELWVHKTTTGPQNQRLDIHLPCHAIAHYLASKYQGDITAMLLTTYILSGCDTVSYPFRIGKKRALKVTFECTEILGPLAEYGTHGKSLDVSTEVVSSARNFFLALYGNKEFSGTLDELRCHLFMTKKGDICSLPPTEDAFLLHLLRSLHQTTICKRASQPDPELPDPCKFGRSKKNGCLLATRMTKPSKPGIVQTHCNCKKGKCKGRCLCRMAGLKCTIACKCCGDPQNCDLASEDEDYLI